MVFILSACGNKLNPITPIDITSSNSATLSPTVLITPNNTDSSNNGNNTVQITSEATLSPYTTYPEVTPSSPLSTDDSLQYINIVSGEVRGFDWLPNDEILCYRIKKDGKTEIWGFDVISGTIDRPNTCTTSRNLPWYDTYIGLPEGAYGQSVSPNGSREIFLMHNYVVPTPTPDAWGGGESNNSQTGDNINVWVLEENNVRLIGEMMDCPYEYRWASDENTIIAIVIQGYGSCSDLLFNIIRMSGEIQPVYSEVMGSKEVVFFGASSDGKKLLYSISRELYILDLETYLSNKIDIQGYDFKNGFWINDSNLMVQYKEMDESSYSIGIVNLQSKDLSKFIIAGEGSLGQGKALHGLEMSPDHKWLAFTTWNQFDYTNITLWIVELYGPGNQ